jgi:hypothetical protein
MVVEEKVCQVPYTICRTVTKEHVKIVPHKTCRLEEYCETQKICRRVAVCVPICSDPCERVEGAPSFTPPPPAVLDKK